MKLKNDHPISASIYTKPVSLSSDLLILLGLGPPCRHFPRYNDAQRNPYYVIKPAFMLKYLYCICVYVKHMYNIAYICTTLIFKIYMNFTKNVHWTLNCTHQARSRLHVELGDSYELGFPEITWEAATCLVAMFHLPKRYSTLIVPMIFDSLCFEFWLCCDVGSSRLRWVIRTFIWKWKWQNGMAHWTRQPPALHVDRLSLGAMEKVGGWTGRERIKESGYGSKSMTFRNGWFKYCKYTNMWSL